MGKQAFWWRPVGLICGVVLQVFPAWAEESDSVGADVYLGDVPVFLTVTRLPQELSETPASVMVIDREMIEASGAIEIADLLRLAPGFIVGHYSDTDGSRTVVSYYGFTDQYARRLQVLVDGMSVYMPATGGVEWPDLPFAVDDIERIEVVRGPNGAAYGSNSFLGVINIITRHPQDSEAKFSATAGTLGYREGAIRLVGGSDEFKYRLNAGYQSSSGYRNVLFPDAAWTEVNDDSITRSLTFRSDYHPSVNDYWTFQAGHANGPRQAGSSNDLLHPVRDVQMNTDYEQIRWRRMVDSDSEIQVQLYRNWHQKKDRFETDLLPAFLTGHPDQRLNVDTSLTSERVNLESSYRFRPWENWRIVWGGEYRIDRVSGETYFDQGGTFANEGYRLFTNAEWQPDEKWTINLGDLYERNDLIAGLHSPRLSVSRKLATPHFIRATASRAYRMPAFAEEKIDFTYRYDEGDVLYQLYRSNGDLKPERIDNVELALGGDGGAYAYEAKVFRNRITSLIAAPVDLTAPPPNTLIPLDADSWRVTNGGEMTLFGTELQATLRPQPDLMINIALATAHATGWRLSEINPDAREDVADSIPRRTFSFMISKQLDGGDRVALGYYRVSPVQHFSGDLTKGVRTADVHYVHPFVSGGRKAQIRVLFRDIMGAYYDFEQETNREYQAFLTLDVAL